MQVQTAAPRRRTCAPDPPSGVEQSAEAARSVASAIAQQPAPARNSQLFGMVDGDQAVRDGDNKKGWFGW